MSDARSMGVRDAAPIRPESTLRGSAPVQAGASEPASNTASSLVMPLSAVPSGPELAVDQGAIARNTRLFQGATSAKIMAVLKADAFGHGPAARIALASGASSIGVASIAEAIALREDGVAAPILSWLNPIGADYAAAIGQGVELAVTGLQQLSAVAAGARHAGSTARTHLHLDVGMARDGTPREEWSALCQIAREFERMGLIAIVGIMGHLSSAETPDDPQNDIERQRFVNGVAAARRRGLRANELHLAASAATLHRPDTHFTLCRVGAGLYGIDPAGIANLESALTLTAPVVQLRRVRANTGVGYGHDHVTARATTLAVLPVGYADGIPRATQGRAEVSVRGVRCSVVGRVSMDQIVVDVGAMPIELGEAATIMGAGKSGEPTIREWAQWAGTIEHEIVTRLGMRSSRVSRTVHAADAEVAR